MGIGACAGFHKSITRQHALRGNIALCRFGNEAAYRWTTCCGLHQRSNRLRGMAKAATAWGDTKTDFDHASLIGCALVAAQPDHLAVRNDQPDRDMPPHLLKHRWRADAAPRQAQTWLWRAPAQHPGEMRVGRLDQNDCHRSASIRAVDVDIAVGQIAGPNPRRALAEAEIDGDLHLAARNRLGGGGFVVFGRALALLGHHMVAEGDFEPVAVGRLRPPCPPPSRCGPNWRRCRRSPFSPAANWRSRARSAWPPRRSARR